MYDQTPEAIAEASDIIEEAIRIEPTGPRAHRVRIQVFVNCPWIEETPYDSAYMARNFELAKTALRLSPGDKHAHLVMA